MVSWVSTIPLLVARWAGQLQAPAASLESLFARCRRAASIARVLKLGQRSETSIWTSPRWNWWFSPGLWFPQPVTSTEQRLRWQPSVKCGDEAESVGSERCQGKMNCSLLGGEHPLFLGFKYLKLCS